jgi:zinc/manganese transport system permease protein
MSELFAANVTTMFDQAFMLHAFLALSVLAPLCGVLGYFLVVRNEVFAGDALSHVGFTGSLAALAYGLDQRLGLFTACVIAAAGIAMLGRHARVGDTAIGVFFMWILGLGVWCLSQFASHHSAEGGGAGVNVLFGSVFGISSGRAWQTVVLCGAALAVLIVIARPLVFVSFDPLIARARGVPVRAVNIVFMVLLGIAVAEAVQVVGALLLLGLIVTPAATVHRLTCRPSRALVYSAALCLVEAWGGLTIAYVLPSLPPAFAIIATGGIVYFAVSVVSRARSATVVARADQVEPVGVQVEA